MKIIILNINDLRIKRIGMDHIFGELNFSHNKH